MNSRRRRAIMQKQTSPSKRFSSRVETPENVYVYWSSAGYDDTSRVRNLSSGGLFVHTRKSRAVGAKTSLHFLVEEGQIRAEAVVRHLKPGRGLGLEFTAVHEEDRQRLADLMKRLRGFGLISRFRTDEPSQQAPLQ
jgi:PilZ domain